MDEAQSSKDLARKSGEAKLFHQMKARGMSNYSLLIHPCL